MLQVKFFPFNAFSENTYIISNEKKNAIIIDPGNFLPREDSAFFDYIEQNELKPIQIVNTHCHLDHVLGVHACKEKYQIPFSFHSTEQQVLDWAPEAAMRYGVPMVHSPKADFYLKEGDNIMLDDDKLKILFAPGHSPGHVCFYSAANNFVIAGDVIFQSSIGRTDLPGGDFDTLMQSIHSQIFTLPDETIIYCGHGPSTTVGIEKMNNPYVKSL